MYIHMYVNKSIYNVGKNIIDEKGRPHFRSLEFYRETN